MDDEFWGIGFTISLIISVILIFAGTAIPNPSGYTYYLSNVANSTTTFSKSLFLIILFYLITLAFYGFSEKKFFSGLLDGASTVLIVTSYLALILMGYNINLLLPLLLGVSMEGGRPSLIVDWGQIALITMVLKYRVKLYNVLRRRRGGAAAGI